MFVLDAIVQEVLEAPTGMAWHNKQMPDRMWAICSLLCQYSTQYKGECESLVGAPRAVKLRVLVEVSSPAEPVIALGDGRLLDWALKADTAGVLCADWAWCHSCRGVHCCSTVLLVFFLRDTPSTTRCHADLLQLNSYQACCASVNQMLSVHAFALVD